MTPLVYQRNRPLRTLVVMRAFKIFFSNFPESFRKKSPFWKFPFITSTFPSKKRKRNQKSIKQPQHNPKKKFKKHSHSHLKISSILNPVPKTKLKHIEYHFYNPTLFHKLIIYIQYEALYERTILWSYINTVWQFWGRRVYSYLTFYTN